MNRIGRWLHDKRLLLCSGLCRQRTGLISQVADFVPLILGECHWLHNGNATLVAVGVQHPVSMVRLTSAA
ncbi:MAG: hypothetical protein LUD84_07250 [Clostridiales bacterium]|nr:hypothetical protein [Clostridiales bacterium]